MSTLEILEAPDRSLAGKDVVEFLRNLRQPTAFLLSGRHPGPVRAFVTLLHGNEPSGAMALRRWLLEGRTPAVDSLCVVASVPAALAEPPFSQRMLPRARDLNRCFRPPFEDEQGRLARAILELLEACDPACIVDMHNTSGTGPSFGVCSAVDPERAALAGLFTRHLIVTRLGFGTLMEHSRPECPAITIEVGGRSDPTAHDLAWRGLDHYLSCADPLAGRNDALGHLTLYREPIRLELNEGVVLGYGDAPLPGYDITLRRDIESHNFATVGAGTPLGWVADEPARLFRAQDDQGQCAVARLVRAHRGELYPAGPLRLFMITSNAAIAQSDCLFYAVSTT